MRFWQVGPFKLDLLKKMRQMQDDDSVVFRLKAPAESEHSPLEWFVSELEKGLVSVDLSPTSRKVSNLGYGALSYSVSKGHISIFVLWRACDDTSSWQIRILYFQSFLNRLFQLATPTDVIRKKEDIRQTVHRFLLSQAANSVQWMSATDAERRLRHPGATE
jgi:hypothetical protein